MTGVHRCLALLGACSAGALSLGGCNSAGEGFLTGGTLGALGGMAIGSTAGHMGRGAAIGAVIGAIGGAVIGDQNARAERWSSYPPPPRYYDCSPRSYCSDPYGGWVYIGDRGCGPEWCWRTGPSCCR